jgi:hypothetical protein
MIIGFVSIVDKNEALTIAVVSLCSIGVIFHIFETFNFWFQSQYKSKITSIATFLAYVVTAGYKIVLLILGKDVRWFAFSTSVDYIVVAVFLYVAYKRYGDKLKSDLVQPSHHGQGDGYSPIEFYRTVGAPYVINPGIGDYYGIGEAWARDNCRRYYMRLDLGRFTIDLPLDNG